MYLQYVKCEKAIMETRKTIKKHNSDIMYISTDYNFSENCQIFSTPLQFLITL